jgi:hypothetical protein
MHSLYGGLTERECEFYFFPPNVEVAFSLRLMPLCACAVHALILFGSNHLQQSI